MADNAATVVVAVTEIEGMEAELAQARQYLSELNGKANELSVNIFRLEGAIGFLRNKEQVAQAVQAQ